MVCALCALLTALVAGKLNQQGQVPAQTKKPADGSTYTLTLRDQATGAVLLDQTSVAHYVDGPNLDGCHPECWGAQISIGDATSTGAGGGDGLGLEP